MKRGSVIPFFLVGILSFSVLTTMTVCGGGGGGSNGSVIPLIITTGSDSTLVMMSDGSVLAWGRNNFGKLGTTADGYHTTPFTIGFIMDVKDLAAGDDHALGIRADGTLWGWGRNDYGQIDTTLLSVMLPTQVDTAADWSVASAGDYHSVALKTDGSLWAWGRNDSAQLATDLLVDKLPVPSRIGNQSDWRSISSSARFNLAIKNDGTLWAWGSNSNSECGTDSILSIIDTPTRIGTQANWSFVSAGVDYGVAIRTDGTLWGWGNNNFSKIGVPGGLPETSPLQVGSDTDWMMVSAGGAHTVGLKENGSLWAWGRNNNGQLGTNLTVRQLDEPTRIGTDSDWVTIKAGKTFTVAAKDDGSLWSWGSNSFGQLGNGVVGYKSSPAIASFVSPAAWEAIPPAVSWSHGLAVKTDGTLWAWGDNAGWALANSIDQAKIVPAQVGSDMDWEAAWSGGNTSFGLKTDGTLMAWGDNTYNQLGIVGDYSFVPVQIGVYPDLTVLAPGKEHVMFVRSGTLWAWGRNDHGQCGTNSALLTIDFPAQIGSDVDWEAAAGGDQFSLGLKTDGSLWAWGYNSYGQLGTDLALTEIDTPARIGTGSNWSKVAAGLESSFAIKDDGSLWAWGHNHLKQLGDELLPTSSPVPSRIGTGTNWWYVAGGDRHTLGLKDDGSLWAWGHNYNDILGVGTDQVSQVSPPARIGSDTDWAYVAAGDNFSIGIKDNGTLYGWGTNDKGQVPDGTALVVTPQQVY